MLTQLSDTISSLWEPGPRSPQAPTSSLPLERAVLPAAGKDPAASANLYAGLYDHQSDPDFGKKLAQQADLPVAMMELADKFKISDRPDAPNAVTPDQFKEIASLYSRIRLGHTDIVFDGEGKEAEAFKRGAIQDIAKMLQTGAGRELLGRLADNRHTIGVGEDAFVEHRKTHIGLSATAADANTRAGPADALPENLRAIEARRHDGRGNDARVTYRPGEAFDNTESDGDRVKFTGDTILFHELAHAYHETTGTVPQGGVSAREAHNPLDVGLSREEYYATGLGSHYLDYLTENQYRFERMRMGENVGLRDQYIANEADRRAYENTHGLEPPVRPPPARRIE